MENGEWYLANETVCGRLFVTGEKFGTRGTSSLPLKEGEKMSNDNPHFRAIQFNQGILFERGDDFREMPLEESL